jgi:CheY-like chemotaxis protein
MSSEHTGPRRVLVVDDEPLVRWTLRRTLEEQGFDVTEATSCEEAGQRWDDTQPEVVVTDHRLADGFGLEVIRLRRRRGSRVPAILLTAEAEALAGLDTPDLQPLTVLRKPLAPGQLREAVQTALALDAPGGETGSPCRAVGRFTVLTCTGPMTAAALEHTIRKAVDAGDWLALDCSGMTDGFDAGEVESALAGIMSDRRKRGGTLCLVDVPAVWRDRMETICRRQGIDQVADAGELESLGRRLVSRRERDEVLGSVMR